MTLLIAQAEKFYIFVERNWPVPLIHPLGTNVGVWQRRVRGRSKLSDFKLGFEGMRAVGWSTRSQWQQRLCCSYPNLKPRPKIHRVMLSLITTEVSNNCVGVVWKVTLYWHGAYLDIEDLSRCRPTGVLVTRYLASNFGNSNGSRLHFTSF